MPDGRIVIGFDVSTSKTGVAIGACDGSPRSDVWTFSPNDEIHVRFAKLGLRVAQLVEDERQLNGLPYLAVVEAEVRGGLRGKTNPDTAFALIGGIAVVMATLHMCGVARIRKVPVSTARKAFVGHGTVPGYIDPMTRKKVEGGEAAKRLVREQCRVLGWKFQDHNAADALCIWSYGVGSLRSLFSASHTPLLGRAAE